MATLREIRRRIAGIKSTAKITQAMKMVAAAKMRRAQDAIIAARPYAIEMADLVRDLLTRVDRTALPLLVERHEIDKVLVVVIGADRGLCGAFNTNVIRAAAARIHETYRDMHEAGKVRVMAIGRRVYDHFVKRDYELAGKHVGIFSGLSFANARQIVTEIVDGYMNFEFDRVELIYNEFKSVIQQRLVIEDLLPFPIEQEAEKTVGTHHYHPHLEYIYEPSERELMELLIPRHLNIKLWRALLESNAAEQSARMVAMESATQNAHELLRTLQLSFNRARQSAITKEILEIVGGAEALTGSD